MMRRKDRQADENFALEIVDSCSYATVSMVMPDGRPYGIPLSIVRMDGFLYFHCAPRGKKLDALLACPQVSVACVGRVRPLKNEFTTEYESAIVDGTAVRVTDHDEKVRALRAICLRYTPDHMDAFEDAVRESLHRTDLWRIEIQAITGKRKLYDSEGREIKSGL
ncbi:MAG: pyridoxamine 5'-phosphate oxidase family protein [Saccharofermentanales bacterium]